MKMFYVLGFVSIFFLETTHGADLKSRNEDLGKNSMDKAQMTHKNDDELLGESISIMAKLLLKTLIIVKDANPNLTATELKAVVFNAIDIKSWQKVINIMEQMEKSSAEN